ncbi:MAG: hypothetical protein IT340_04525 [Chloroflexi bacterium]|nr:hypothetical protein [Chloroflexota bacterium]
MLTVDSRSRAAGALRTRLTAATERPGWRWLVGLAGLALVLAGLALGLAWSYRTAVPFALDLGSRDADPFISGFHAAERTPDGALTFRWTRGSAGIVAPGFGRRDAVLTLALAGAGRGNAPLPAVTVLAGGQEVAQIQTTAAVQRFTVPIAASLMDGGDVRVELRTSEFQPPNDARRLGVLVDAISVEAIDGVPALPPWRLALLATTTVVAVALVAALVLGRPGMALALAGVTAVALVVASRLDRFTWALWLADGVPLVIASGSIAVAGAIVGRWTGRRRAPIDPVDGVDETAQIGSHGGLPLPADNHGPEQGHAPISSPTGPPAVGALREASLPIHSPGPTTAPIGPLALILWSVALANLLGVAHPQFRSSDLTMNVHRLEEVARGSWLFTLALPGPSALPAPYPPAFYALLLPLLPLVDHDFGLKQALVTHASAALLTALAGIAYVVGARVGGPAAGLWAAALQGFAPAGFLLVSQGNFANVFGQAAAGLVLLLLAVLPDWRRPLPALAIVAALLVALLGHFGIFLSLLLAVPVMAVFVATLPPPGRRQALTLASLFAVALLLAVALYYRHYIGLVAEVAQRVVAARTAGDATAALGWNAGLGLEGRRTIEALGWLALPLAAGGLVGLWRGAQAGRVTLGWLTAGAVFALVGLVVGLSVRYQFFALLGLAVAGGLTLAWLGRRGWVGRGLAVLLAVAWVGGGLLFWYTRILTYLH